MILDASALLALILKEPGSDMVAAEVAGAAISSINFAEVVSRLARHGAPFAEARDLANGLNIEVVAAERQDAIDAGLLKEQTRAAGLSLGDCFCLALARSRGLPALTADRAWATIADSVGVDVVAIR